MSLKRQKIESKQNAEVKTADFIDYAKRRQDLLVEYHASGPAYSIRPANKSAWLLITFTGFSFDLHRHDSLFLSAGPELLENVLIHHRRCGTDFTLLVPHEKPLTHWWDSDSKRMKAHSNDCSDLDCLDPELVFAHIFTGLPAEGVYELLYSLIVSLPEEVIAMIYSYLELNDDWLVS